MKPDPRLNISYIGPSGAIEVLSISPKAAARRWPGLFAEFARQVARETERANVSQPRLSGLTSGPPARRSQEAE